MRNRGYDARRDKCSPGKGYPVTNDFVLASGFANLALLFGIWLGCCHVLGECPLWVKFFQDGSQCPLPWAEHHLELSGLVGVLSGFKA